MPRKINSPIISNLNLVCKEKAPWREDSYAVLADAYIAYIANGQKQLADEARLEYNRIKSIKQKLYASCLSL